MQHYQCFGKNWKASFLQNGTEKGRLLFCSFEGIIAIHLSPSGAFIFSFKQDINNPCSFDTVKLDYNELGYNEHSVITNKKIQSQITTLLHKTTRL